jgi:hypothetical protein
MERQQQAADDYPRVIVFNEETVNDKLEILLKIALNDSQILSAIPGYL